MKVWPYLIAGLMLAGTWGIIQSLSDGEPVVFKKPFKEFPRTLADRWMGVDLVMKKEVLNKLQLSDYLMRVYRPTGTRASDRMPNDGDKQTFQNTNDQLQGNPVWLYVGYYRSQRTGATYHSPKNCLPGAGWQFIDSDYVSPAIPNAENVTINKVLIQKGLDQQVILYWYQDRGRTVASEYWAKVYMIWDSMIKNRTDGSLVRISIPVVKSPEEAYQHGLRFLKDVWPSLLDYMPSHDI